MYEFSRPRCSCRSQHPVHLLDPRYQSPHFLPKVTKLTVENQHFNYAFSCYRGIIEIGALDGCDLAFFERMRLVRTERVEEQRWVSITAMLRYVPLCLA